jgi:hypothetical protein
MPLSPNDVAYEFFPAGAAPNVNATPDVDSIVTGKHVECAALRAFNAALLL